jgi:hypothetical protein
MARLTVLGLVAAVTAVAAPAHGQPAADGAAYLGPIRCYIDVTENAYLESLKAKDLCTGAADEAPSRCFMEATDRVAITDPQAVSLCRATSSIAPAICAERLEDTTNLVASSIVEYCAALRWPLVPAGTGGAPECVRAALDRTTLVHDQAARLCAGSVSTAPVACFELGQEETTLFETDIVDLCAATVIATPAWPVR